MVQLSKPNMKIAKRTSQDLLKTLLLSLVSLSGLQLLASASILAGNPSWLQVIGILAYRILIGIQGCLILCMLGCVIHFHLCLEGVNKSEAQESTVHCWSLTLFGLYFSLSAILLRIVYRSVELLQVFDFNSILPHKEVFFYALESAPTLAAIAVWVIVPINHVGESSQKDVGYQYQEIIEAVEEGYGLRDQSISSQN